MAHEHDVSDVEDLSDEQIKMLLSRAEKRLQGHHAIDAPSNEVALSPPTTHATSIPKLRATLVGKSDIITIANGVARADPRSLVSENDRKLSNNTRRVEDPVLIKQRKAEKQKASAKDWFDLPRTDLTPELKRDLQLLKMRGVLDPKRFYKKDNSKNAVPEFSQVGRIIEGPTEYFSSRLPNKDRKRTFVEEVLEQETSTGRFKRKYGELQASKTSGKKAFYKGLKEKRSRSVKKT